MELDNVLVELPPISDHRGSLISLEALKGVPFPIKRVYYMYNLKPLEPRGFHAHENLEQVMVCVSGSCRIFIDSGGGQKDYILNKPNQSLYIGKMVWREMSNFSNDCVLMVLASEHYDESDYIRDYDTFIERKIGIGFKEYDEGFLALSSKWLSDQEIKRLTMAPEIDVARQKEWFRTLKERTDYYIKGIEYKGTKIGAAGLKNITAESAEYWGYIGEKDYWSKGLGKFMVDHCLRHAGRLGIPYVYLYVTPDNERAIKLYRKHGFVALSSSQGKLLMVRKL